MAISKERQEKLIETRRTAIINAAMELFDTKGYANTKIADIASKANISKGLIYHYFHTKEEIILDLKQYIKPCIDECFNIPEADEAMKEFSLRVLSYPYYHDYIPPFRILFTAIIRGELPNRSLKDIIDILGENFGQDYFGALFQRGQDSGIFKEGDPKKFGEIYWNFVVGYLANMSVYKEDGKVYQPDIDALIDVFRK